MLISVITPAKNNAKFLKNCIESVIKQSEKMEHIIIDGGSTDDTFSLLKEYDHIKWLSEADGGMYDAINKGLNISQGEIIGYLNADDRYFCNTASNVLHVFKNNPEIDFLYGACTYIDKNENVLYTYKALPYINNIIKNMKEICWAQPSCFWRRRVHNHIGVFDSTLKYCGDYDFFLRLILNNIKGVRINSALCLFMIHDNSLSATSEEAMLEEYNNIGQKYGLKRNFLLGMIGEIYFKLINIKIYLNSNYSKSLRNSGLIRKTNRGKFFE